MKRRTGLIYFLALAMAVSIAQNGSTDEDPCEADSSQESCDACIAASYTCSWCPYPPNTTIEEDNVLRCRSGSSPCPGDVPEQDPQSTITIIKNESLSINATADSIQVTPQNISMELRRGFSSSFNMTFRSLRNSPLDIYFLLDVSNSLNVVLSILQNDLQDIANSLAEVSTAFLMGFGSFVDKPILPFALDDYRRADPNGVLACRAFESCVPTYSFRNSQPLTANVTQISNSINEFAMLSSNIDSPEGGLEALLQVAVCTNETGWRPNALHMVFLITDQGYHAAGDGRVAGIVTPNDGLCHLEIGETGTLEYTHGLLQDYPSVAQLRDILEANLIVPIFTLSPSTQDRVEFSLRPTYARLTQEIRASVQAAQSISFEESSVEQIIAVIREAYETTVQTISVNNPNLESEGYRFEINPVSGCDNRTEDGACQLQFDEEVTFEVTVTLEDCELAGSEPRRVQLLGPPFSFTTIDLIPVCQCPCSLEEPDEDSEICTERGDLSCGVCSCQTSPIEYFGDQCECDEVISDCPSSFLSNEFNGPCSGRGDCTSCGTCRCFNNTFGTACQCSEGDCFNSCSGNGECTCEEPGSIPECRCNTVNLGGTEFSFFQGMVGNPGNCMCNPANCFDAQYPGELCHNTLANSDGREFCRCNQCLCPDDLASPQGRNICIPVSDICLDIQDCTRCRAGDTEGRNCDDCRLDEIRDLENGPVPGSDTARCEEVVGSCVYTFYVQTSGGNQVLTFTRECTTNTLPYIIAGSLVGAIIVLGLLALIILKLCLVFWDRIEYRKFIQEFKEADFAPHENPLYLTPQQDYPNPALRVKKPAVSEPVPQEGELVERMYVAPQ